jgi:hypothetical protein
MSGGIEGEGPRGEPTAQPPRPPEQPKPQQESSVKGPLARMRENIGDRQTLWRCTIPKQIFSPVDIPRLYDQEMSTEEAIERGQPWVENLKTLDSQNLERKLDLLERYRRDDSRRPRLRNRDQYEELLEYEIKAIREQLRQRES